MKKEAKSKGGVKMAGNLPIKKWRAGSLDVAVWENKRTVREGEEISFKTVTLRRSWKDREQDLWRDEKINLRKADIPKVLVLLNKVNEELLLSEEHKEEGDE